MYADLYEISKLLLAEDDAERAPEVLLRRIVERCGAERVSWWSARGGSYQQRFEVGEERGRRSELERRFSRTLVREAIVTGKLLYLPNLIEDPRFATGESGLVIGRCSVLVAPAEDRLATPRRQRGSSGARVFKRADRACAPGRPSPARPGSPGLR